MKSISLAACTLLALGLAGPATAQVLLEPAPVIPAGALVLEHSTEYSHARSHARENTSAWSTPGFLLRVGLPYAELLTGSTFVQENTTLPGGGSLHQQGWTDVFLGAKVPVLAEETGPLSASLWAAAVLPVGSPDVRPTHVTSEVYLLLERTFAGVWTLDANLGGSYHRAEGATWAVSGALIRALGDRLALYAEVLGEQAPEAAAWTGGLGISLSPLPTLHLDLAGGRSLNGPTRAYYAGAVLALDLIH
ncbi:MAG: hypothetical protein D6790_06580 [Caldilineae bacterium]|nr:MAG: hypothetical protein D6790_06580 [Caldilineae bacterium]